MAINYMNDIVIPLFASNVETVAAYQAPGTFGLPTGFGFLTLGSASVIAATGSSYAANNVLTLVGGTRSVAATITAKTVDGSGHVTSFSVTNPGNYTVAPTNPVAVTGGAGSGFTLTAAWLGYAQQRMLTIVELFRSYLALVDNTHEAKILQGVLRRMIAEMDFGTVAWNATTVPTHAQKAAMNFIAKHKIPSDI